MGPQDPPALKVGRARESKQQESRSSRHRRRLSELDPSDFLHAPAKTVEEEKRELWELFESAKVVGAVVEARAPEAEQPRRKSSLMEAERMRDALKNRLPGGDSGVDAFDLSSLTGAELMKLETEFEHLNED